MLNNLTPVARFIKPWTGLSSIENATQAFCTVLRAKLIEQKVYMLSRDLLHLSLLRASLTEVLQRNIRDNTVSSSGSISQHPAHILDLFASYLIYIYTVPQPSLQELSKRVVLSADNTLMKQSTQMVSFQLTLKKSSVIVSIFFQN